MNEKMQDEEFLTDVEPLLRLGVSFNPQEAYQLVLNKIIDKMNEENTSQSSCEP